jgi:hypothetical protein
MCKMQKEIYEHFFLSNYISPLKRIKTISDLTILKYTSKALTDGTETFRSW